MLFFALDEQLCSTNTETIILCTYNPLCCNWHGANGVQAYDYVRAVDVWLCGRVGVIEKLGMEWQVWSRAVAGRGRGDPATCMPIEAADETTERRRRSVGRTWPVSSHRQSEIVLDVRRMERM
jgi:hypothetical protein